MEGVRARVSATISGVLLLFLASTSAYGLSDFERFSDDYLAQQFTSVTFYRDWKLTDSGWGETPLDELAEVLRATTEIMFEGIPEQYLENIKVSIFSWDLLPGDVAYGGRAYTAGRVFNVFLKPYERDWRRYVNVFAHELCHVLDANSSTPAKFRWFEETLCQTASLYVMKRLAERWSKSEHPGQHSYSAYLFEYFRFLYDQPHRRLRPGHSLAGWYQNQGSSLENQWEDYSKNDLVARRLMPMFDGATGAWQNLIFLRQIENAPDFQAYLRRWRQLVPVEQQAFVDSLAMAFGYNVAPRSQGFAVSD